MAAFGADPISATEARQFVRKSLSSMNVEPEVTDRVELVVSELVTNAVLHAGTGPTVTLHADDERVRLEVHDSSSTQPMLRNYGSDAMTGRGLSVVASIARDWGIDPVVGGKTVWVEISRSNDDSQTAQLRDAPFPLDPDVEPKPGARSVRLIGVPVRLFLAVDQQNSSLLREFELLAIQLFESGPGLSNMSAELAQLVIRANPYFNSPPGRFQAAVKRAETHGDELVDLFTFATPATIESGANFTTLMEEADELCRDGVLLTPPSSREVVTLRRWFIYEMRNQVLDGKPPRQAPRMAAGTN